MDEARDPDGKKASSANDTDLNQSEWLRITLSSIGDAVIATDAEGRVNFMNGVAETLTGWPLAEAFGRPLPDVFHIVNEQTRLPAENPALRALRDGVTVGLANHTALIARDGSERLIDDSAAPVRTDAGALVGAVLIFRDVTERRRAEEARSRLAAIVDSSQDAIVGKSLDGVISSWNAGAERLFGYSAAEAIGRPITIIIPPELLHEERSIIDRVRRGVRVETFDTTRVTKDGRRIDISLSVSPVRDADGNVIGASKVARDVTEQRRAAAALRESENRFRALVTATSEVVYRMSPDWAEMQPLDGRGLVASNDDPIRDWLRKNIPAAEHGRVRAEIARAVAGRQTFELEHQIIRPDGTPGWTFSRAVPILDAGGNVVEWFGAASDVTDRKWAEEALDRVTAESARRKRLYETVLSNTPDLVYVFDLGHRFTYANEALLAMWGKTWDEAIGKNCLELGYEPWHAAMHDREIEEVVATRRPIRGEVPFTGTHGRRIYDYIFAPVFGADGEVEAVAGTTRDVTDRKLAEERRRILDERYRTLFTAIDQGFCVVEVLFAGEEPVDYRFVEANPVFEQQSGLADPVGRTIRELAPDIEERWIEIYGRVATTGESARFVEHSRALGRWFDVFASPLGGPGSRSVAILFSDITARRRAEAEREQLLREVETERGRLAEAFRHAPAFMAVLRGPDHVFERANDRYIELVGGRAVIGRTLRDALPEVVGQGFIDLLDKVYRTGEAFVGVGTRVLLNRGAGLPPDERFLDFVYQPLRDAGGAVTGVLVQGVDLTERRRAEEALKDADRKKDDFIALLAHELRNPLAPIRNGLQVIRLTDDPAKRAKAQAMMDRQLNHMVRMIDDLLDVSRIGRNKMTLRRERIALADVVGSAVETARPAIQEAGHELTVSLPARQIHLDADLTRLSQVVSNLLSNSAKYTERGGKIWLSAEPAAGGVAVSVRDTGIGIPAEALPTIFDMFSQVDRTTERSSGGLGIGLALVKGLVEMHGGAVTAESDGPGRGSTFRVWLPVLEQPVHPPVPAPPDDLRAICGRRILVVDDNLDGAASMAEMLSLLGDDVRTANDGLEAVAVAEAFRPELILMDIGMPRLNGLDATRRIRQQPWGKDITIIALTGWGQTNDRERSRTAGIDAHLVKPVTLSDLEHVLSGLGRKRK